MRISILTLFPDMFEGFKQSSIIARALNSDKASIEIINIRDFTKEKHGHVDDTPYGGGAGMIMRVQPVLDALNSIRTKNSYVILTSAIGERFKQQMVRQYVSNISHLIIICGHYEGIDYRINQYVDQLVSIGDFILTGGELVAMMISDACIRLVEGVILKESHLDESFENGLLEYPQYTKPYCYDNQCVPDILLSGHHENIRKYRLKESLRTTYLHRKDLLEQKVLNKEERLLLKEIEDELETN